MDIIYLITKKIDDYLLSVNCSKDIKFNVTPAKKKEYGDFSTNVAMVLGKQLEKDPNLVAEEIISYLYKNTDWIEKLNNISGFINIYIKYSIWGKLIHDINTKGANFGFEDLGKNQKLHIEFVSANPTGPLHLGHIRGAVIFDTLAEIFKKSNFNITKEYYINDAGKQVHTLIKSVFLRYKEQITKNKIENFPEGCYPGAYIEDIAEHLLEIYGETLLNCDENQFYLKVKGACINFIMDLIKKDLNKLNIFYDTFISEESLHQNGYIDKAINILEIKNLITEEELEQPKGTSKNWEKRKQVVFLAKNFGDDENRALNKSDGSWTYFASDVAYHFFKLERGFNQMIVGLGADHAGYVKRLKALVNALSDNQAKIDVQLYNLVNLLNNGEQIKLSKRNGNIISLDDIVERGVSPEEVRFAMLTKSSDMILDFDIAKFLEDSYNNPIFYVQYASARCHSVLSKYQGDNSNCTFNIKLLKSNQELELIKTLAKWPNTIKIIIKTFDVHKLIFYIQEVAEKFHALWNLGMQDSNFRFIVDDKNLTDSRIFLVIATKNVIASVLEVLKIKPVTQM
jgi:arginyl-tRNA synthetase